MYEVDMLNGSFGYYLGKPEKELIENNMAVETFLLHARALIDFLTNSKRPQYSDDLACGDFMDEHGVPIAAQELPLASELKTRIHKQVAHITTQRMVEGTDWQMGIVRDALNLAALVFLRQCADEYFEQNEKEEFIARLEAPL